MRRSDCPIAATLDLIGDRWTLVVLRDILLVHRYGFSEIAAKEGIATNIKVDRLDRLVEAGLLERRVDEADRRRRTYLPMERAIELIGVLVDLLVWGNANTDAPGRSEEAGAARAERDTVIRQLEAAARENAAALRGASAQEALRQSALAAATDTAAADQEWVDEISQFKGEDFGIQ